MLMSITYMYILFAKKKKQIAYIRKEKNPT